MYGLIFLEYREVETGYPEWRGYKPVPVNKWVAQYEGRKITLFNEISLRRTARATENMASYNRLCDYLMEAVRQATVNWECTPQEWLILPDFRGD